MPPSKRQKTGRQSSASTTAPHKDNSLSPTPHKNDGSAGKRDLKDISPHEYVCFPRPLFDFELENQEKGTKSLSSDEVYQLYTKNFDKEKEIGTMVQPAAERKNWKWVTQLESLDKFHEWTRRAKYCDPDLFGMHIATDWKGWGLQEIVENMIVEFDKQMKKRHEESLHKMWAVISALGLWLNHEATEHDLINNEDGETVMALTRLMGYALLAALASVDHAGEMKRDSIFLDLPLVISLFLEFVHDLPAYGIEGDDVAWASEAVKYFKKANLEPKKGVSGTVELLKQCEKLKPSDLHETWVEPLNEQLILRSEKDSWGWDMRLKEYKKHRGPKLGGTKYDITKFTRAERAEHAFDGKDPLKTFSQKELRENLLDFGPA